MDDRAGLLPATCLGEGRDDEPAKREMAERGGRQTDGSQATSESTDQEVASQQIDHAEDNIVFREVAITRRKSIPTSRLSPRRRPPGHFIPAIHDWNYEPADRLSGGGETSGWLENVILQP